MRRLSPLKRTPILTSRVVALRDQVWDLENSLVGPESDNPRHYADAIYATVTKRVAAPVSVVDAYGRILSYHLLQALFFCPVSIPDLSLQQRHRQRVRPLSQQRPFAS